MQPLPHQLHTLCGNYWSFVADAAGFSHQQTSLRREKIAKENQLRLTASISSAY